METPAPSEPAIPDFTEQMPLYQCHKIVRALKIKEIIRNPINMALEDGVDTTIGFNYELVFDNASFQPFTVTEQWMKRTHCAAGGYLVRYDDNYVSWSPAKAFEDGYTRMSSRENPLTIEELNRVAEQAMTGYPKTNYDPNKSTE